jgi:hypothetical protein
MVAQPPSPLIEFAKTGKILRPCPGQDTFLRAGKFKSAPEVGQPDWRAKRYADVDTARACFPLKTEWQAIAAQRAMDVLRAAPPPLVPARAPRSAVEYAGHQGKQAVGLGRKARAAGWYVEPVYWRAADGSEGCAARLMHRDGTRRAVATWKRPADRAGTKAGWAVDLAYYWVTDGRNFPTRMTHTELEMIFSAG